MPTVSELDAQIADLKKQRDVASLDGTKAVAAALVAGKCATLADDLEALLDNLSPESVAAQQAGYIINVMRNGKNLVDAEAARIQALVDAQAGADET